MRVSPLPASLAILHALKCSKTNSRRPWPFQPFSFSAFQHFSISAFGQFTTPIDTTTLTTNSYTLIYQLTIVGVCTNAPATTVNTNYLVEGDSALAESTKINTGFTNAWLWSQAQSNYVVRVNANLVLTSNNFVVASNRLSSFLATNIPGEPQFLHFLTTNTVVRDFYNFLATNVPGGGGGGGNVTYGGPMLFDFDGMTTNITSDGHGNVGLNSLVATNLTTSFIPDDGNDPPSSYGVQWAAWDTGLPLMVVHAFGGGIMAQDYITYSGTMFSWSFVDGPTETRWGYLNVSETPGQINWTLNPDNGMTENFAIAGQLSWDSGASFSDFNGGLTLANGGFVCDDSGNVTAQTFNPVSDRALKEQIKPLSPANALAMVLNLTNYSWRFKARTNYAVISLPATLSKNQVIFTRTNTVGTILTYTNWVTVTNSYTFTTNIAKILPASGMEFGPMAQDWRAATGLQDGHKISATSEAGLLIGAVQGLAALQGIFTNAAGARFQVLVNSQTNGFKFVPQ